MEENMSPEWAEEQKPKRTTFLFILCILTFIGSGYSVLYHVVLSFAHTQIPELVKVYSDFWAYRAEVAEQMEQIFEFMASVPSWQYLLLALFYSGNIIGAAYMLQLKKVGLHIYTISQMAIFSIEAFMIGGLLKPQVADILWSLTFILLYYTQLRKSMSRNVNDYEI